MITPKNEPLNLLIASYLEPMWVERIRAVSDQLNVIYHPELLPTPRYPSDHIGAPLKRSPEAQRRWNDLLAEADILFDFDRMNMQELPHLAKKVRWLQATSAGIGQFILHFRYHELMPETIFTTASGVHSRPLAEFVIMSTIMHYKKASLIREAQAARHWERFSGTDLEGRAIGILGLGHNGSEVARLTRLLGMRTFGSDLLHKPELVDRFFPADRWREMLPELDVLVLAVPHTPKTEKIVSEEELKLLPTGAFLINICRGSVIDEQALIDALRSAHLSGAALDVFEQEPLPVENPLWEMPNVMVSPHSASTSDRENERITALFCDNLRRFLSGEPLQNVLDAERMY